MLSTEIVKADTVTSNATVNVSMSCTMSAAPGPGGTATTDGYLYSTTIDPGTHKEIEGSILTTSCNGTGNYSLYAIGYSGDSYDTPTNTQMIGSGTSAGTNIVTGTATSGGTSNWAFKLATSGSYSPTIISPYNNYANIPGDDFVKVANYIPGTTGSASSSSVQAKYQVYVTSTQPVGTYTGKVKYTMVYPNDAPRPSTKPYMQDATLADCGQTMHDKRDTGTRTDYTTALIGGQCWMTTNLNLAGGTALSATDTDVTSDYISSFSTSNNLTKSGSTIVLPASSTSGFWGANDSYMYNSTITDCASTSGCYGYYSWDAATLGSGRSISTDNTDAPYSICPKGWHLPNTRTGTDNSSDLRALMIALGGSASATGYASDTSPTGAAMYNALTASPNNFVSAGLYWGDTHYSGGSRGYIWSSTSSSGNTQARYLIFDSGYVESASAYGRESGVSVRCVLGS